MQVTGEQGEQSCVHSVSWGCSLHKPPVRADIYLSLGLGLSLS